MPGEKTEKASDKKREDERKKGHIFQSQDLICAVGLLGSFGLMKAFGSKFEAALATGMTNMLGRAADPVQGTGDVRNWMFGMAAVMAEILVPVFAVTVLCSVAATFAQTRLLVTPSQLAPKFGRISPIEGFKKVFSIKSLVEMVKSLLKIAVVFAVILMDLYPQLSQMIRLFDSPLPSAMQWLGALIVDVGLKAGAILLVIGVGDYFFQWWDYERNIRMTKQEVKDEFKETEGNPQIKGRIRSLQRKMARMRMMKAVPKADAVVRNPTHFAVALKYDEKSGKAPYVVAKGKDNVALKIVEIAEENKVFITENRPLAQALYKSVEIGEEIPAEFYKAVAEILAFIYRMKRAGRK